MFGTLGGPELFLILVVALIVFGPRKLPEIGKSVGKMMAEFRKASNDFKRTIEDEVEAEKLREATRIDPPSWSSSEPAPAALPPAGTDSALGTPSEVSGRSGEDGSTEVASGTPVTDPGVAEGASTGTGEVAGGSADDEKAAPAETVSRGTLPGETK
jgi:Tat protein translocase TatB subunit